MTAGLALGLVASLAAGCASRSAAPSAPGTGPGEPAPSGAAARAPHLGAPPLHVTPGTPGAPALALELEQIFAAPALGTAVVGALVQSLDTGEVLYRLNPNTLAVPASNMKIVTMAVGAARLGWDYRYETRLEAMAPIADGVLQGDLFVVGTGDPTINARSGDRLAVFQEWARQLRAAGIARVAGRLVGDDDAFDDERFGDGWSWDNFAYDYSAPVGALQFNENFVELRVRPGQQVGDPAQVELHPPGSDLVLADVRVTTAEPGTRTRVSFRRLPGRPDLSVRGTIALDSAQSVSRAAVDNPTVYFASVLRDTLRAAGVVVDGEAVDIDDVADAAPLKASGPQRRVLVRHQSPPLAEIGKTLMKVSQNLYAETVLRTLSLVPGPASVDASRDAVADTLRGWGIAPGEFVVRDGSGLSRLNFVSATTIVRILRALSRDADSFAAFEATLPIAGRDGTIASRLKATRAEGNAIAKTGTLSNVRALSGYVRTPDGERLVFSFLMNNFTVPTPAVDAVVDLAVERLANFRR